MGITGIFLRSGGLGIPHPVMARPEHDNIPETASANDHAEPRAKPDVDANVNVNVSVEAGVDGTVVAVKERLGPLLGRTVGPFGEPRLIRVVADGDQAGAEFVKVAVV